MGARRHAGHAQPADRRHAGGGGPDHLGPADIPATGHYCFVAGLIGNAQDPAPAPGRFPRLEQLHAVFIRANNNVTWRNFNVVNNVPPPGADMIAQPFLMAGAFDRTRRMRLEVVLRLPRGSKAELRLPEHLVEYLPAQPGPVPESG